MPLNGNQMPLKLDSGAPEKWPQMELRFVTAAVSDKSAFKISYFLFFDTRLVCNLSLSKFIP